MENRRRANFGASATKGREPADQILPAMPIRVKLSTYKANYTLETEGSAPVFRVHHYEEEPESAANWDAYALRATFERLQSPKDALEFLSTLGCPFRSSGSDAKITHLHLLPWSELQGWQQIVRRLRLTDPSEEFPMLGGFFCLGPHKSGRKMDFKLYFKAAFGEGLADLAEQIWDVADDTFYGLQGIPPKLLIRRDMYLSRAEIEEIFSAPGSRTTDSREWHYAQSVFKHRKTDKARGTPELKQNLIAEIYVPTPLDAILATVYVDKLRGRDWRVCALKECNEEFEKSSDSRKIYCSQAHAHLASVRHKREEARKASKPMKLRKAS